MLRIAKKNCFCSNTEKGKIIEQKLSPLPPLTLSYISIHISPTWSKICCLHINRNKRRKGKGRKPQRCVRLYHNGKFPLYLVPQKFVYIGRIPFVKILDWWGAVLFFEKWEAHSQLEMELNSVEIENLEINSFTIISPCIPLGKHSCSETHTSVRETLY